jgi:hypothetical protein|tara:strand:- start:160 stop:405 length:246 start_codon:yes stop_codon:yes gene_type:complete
VRGHVLWRFVQLVHSRGDVFVLRHGVDGRSGAVEEVHHATSIVTVHGGFLPRGLRFVVHEVLEDFTVFANVRHGEHVGFVR